MVNINKEDLQVLLDKKEIEELIYRFDYLSDAGKAVEAIDRYCTGDVVFETGPFGTTEGIDAAKENARETFAELPFTRHMMHNPLIEVIGDKATGKWYAEIPSITVNDEAVWVQGTYEINLRRVDGEWKISRYAFDITYAAPYEKGWAKQPFIDGVPGELKWK